MQVKITASGGTVAIEGEQTKRVDPLTLGMFEPEAGVTMEIVAEHFRSGNFKFHAQTDATPATKAPKDK
jgi:hypothetical protein